MSNGPTRREFAGAALVAAVAGTLPACADPQRVAHLDELVDGEPVTFRYPDNHPAFLVRLSGPAEGGVGPNNNIVAFHQACPHMGCPLPLHDKRLLGAGELGPCACHRSTFDMRYKGRQLFGRATQNLVRVQLEMRGNYVYAIGIEGRPFGEATRVDG